MKGKILCPAGCQNPVARITKAKEILKNPRPAGSWRPLKCIFNIVVLSDGIVAENGTHEELMKENVLASGDRDHILSGVFNQFLSEKSEPAE